MTLAVTLSLWCTAASKRLTSDTARLDAEVLLCHTLGITRTELYTWPDKPIDREHTETLEQHLLDRISGKPLAYITGEREFWSLPIHVTPDVLIPRADTETLVEYAIECYQSTGGPVLELGTGSGAIAIALAHELQTPIIASDDSERAIAIACENAQRLAPGLIDFVNGSWGEPFAGDSFKLIVSNPPYIDPSDSHLDSPELVYEPQSALISANMGLADIEIILIDALRVGRNGCRVILEHGHTQAAAVQKLMEKNNYKDIVSKKDLAGHERITAGTCTKN